MALALPPRPSSPLTRSCNEATCSARLIAWVSPPEARTRGSSCRSATPRSRPRSLARGRPPGRPPARRLAHRRCWCSVAAGQEGRDRAAPGAFWGWRSRWSRSRPETVSWKAWNRSTGWARPREPNPQRSAGPRPAPVNRCLDCRRPSASVAPYRPHDLDRDAVALHDRDERSASPRVCDGSGQRLSVQLM
jgi:hypothetical protein